MTEHATPEAPTFPAAELDRRFYAFTLDRLIAWTLYAVASVAAYHFLIARDHLWAGVAVIVAVVLLVGLGFSLLLGLRGTSPGKAAVGLRAVHHGTGTPVGAGAGLLRSLILGVSALPTFGLGVATLAWTAVMDRGRQRRGWHDHVTHSIVVDVRPVPVEEEEQAAAPRHIVNLTAMRLVPAPQPAPVSAPARAQRAAATMPVPAVPTPASAVPAPAPFEPVAAPVPRPAEQPSGSAGQPSGPVVPAARHAAPPVARTDAPPSTPQAPGRRQRLGPPLVDLPPVQPPVQPPAQPPVQRPLGPPPVAPPVPGRSTAERTVIRGDDQRGRRALALWRVTFDTGESFQVEGLALVGRRPEPRQGEPVRHLVPLRSGDMSLSKTHAQFQVAPDGVLVVMDRGSTNGSILIRQGVSRELTAGRPATLLDGDRVRFGDREMSVTRES
ncbi:RDD family protein [Nocardioides sp. MAHUQ-72]|uniref:RDD family protein n=1 Tax=unclassified Nocardioides TaxID=2615069 RepID=UPI0036190F6D